jgi:hypothetical protein
VVALLAHDLDGTQFIGTFSSSLEAFRWVKTCASDDYDSYSSHGSYLPNSPSSGYYSHHYYRKTTGNWEARFSG